MHIFESDTDKQWERFGATDPYFGVVTHPKYHKQNLTDSDRAEFFASGTALVAEVFATVRRHLDPAFSPSRVLDFGCGVGRLVIPFAAHAAEVVGVDVSPSMLKEAEANCRRAGVNNVVLLRSDDSVGVLGGTFDLIHSYIVFQHIPVARGERIFSRLLDRLQPGGIGAVQFTYVTPDHGTHIVDWLKRWLPYRDVVSNLVHGRPLAAPVLRMHAYDLDRILHMVQRLGVREFHMTFSDHSGALGVMLFFRRPVLSP